MKDADDPFEPVDDMSEFRKTLRSRAEERLESLKDPELTALGPEETKELVHKLRVHQIELEIQNEELRRAQDEISSAQARYFDLYDMAPVGYCTLNEEGLILESNLTAAALLGVVREALVKKPFSRVVLNEDQDIYYLHNLRLVKTGFPQAFELRLKKNDGTTFWARLNTTTMRDGTNAPVFLVVLSDITEHKKTVEDLRQSENRFRKLFEQHSAVKVILDTGTGRVIDANEAAVRFYGWPLEELKQMNIQQINTLPPEEVKAELKKAALSGNASFEFRHRRADGSIRDVEVFSNKIKSGGRDYLYSIIHDITERKWAETALRRSEEWYHSLFNLMLEGFCVIEMQFDADNRPVDYRFLEINPAFEKQTGLHNVQGKLIRELIPENEAHWFEIYGKVALTGESMRFVNEVKALNRWYDVSAYRIEETDSRKVAILFNDITESRHAHAALEQLNKELEKRVLERTRDLAGYIERLQLEIADREKAEASVQRLNRLYAVLSEINQALVRTNNRDAIFNEFCRIAVKKGGFKLAWVGLVDEKSGELKPVASAGATGYLKDLKITSNEEPAGRGPTGISIRERTYSICNDFLESPITRPWHERGQSHGIRSSASIALKQEGQVIGALTLYADQKDFFDQQQVALLQQIGADISFALDVMVRETKRRKAEQVLREETVERRRAESEIRTLNAELEQRVVERTAELIVAHKEAQETNERLRLEIGGRKKVEKELLQSKKQLQAINDQLEKRVEQRTLELQETQSQFLHAEKLSAVGKLSASIAHEFNNPLQGIMSILKGVKKRAILEEEDRELLDAAICESERMKNLIRSLQDFNRPSLGKKVVVDVHKSLDSLLTLCKNDFKTKRISTVLNYAEQVPHIMAVPDQIKQVFLNLLTNAADACLQRGGVITISTWQEEKSVAVAIEDTGTGIAPENIDLIFQPFYTTKAEVKGTGLGLSVCHGIVQRHHGEIRIESRAGEGAIFTVLLPVTGE